MHTVRGNPGSWSRSRGLLAKLHVLEPERTRLGDARLGIRFGQHRRRLEAPGRTRCRGGFRRPARGRSHRLRQACELLDVATLHRREGTALRARPLHFRPRRLRARRARRRRQRGDGAASRAVEFTPLGVRSGQPLERLQRLDPRARHARGRELVEAAREGVERDRRRTIDLLGHAQGGRFEVEGTPELSRAGRQLLDLRPILSSDGGSALREQAIDRDSILDRLAVTCLRADRLEQRSRSTEIEVAHERVPPAAVARRWDRAIASPESAGASSCFMIAVLPPAYPTRKGRLGRAPGPRVAAIPFSRAPSERSTALRFFQPLGKRSRIWWTASSRRFVFRSNDVVGTRRACASPTQA